MFLYKDGLFVDAKCNSPRVLHLIKAHNHGEAFNFKEFAQQQVESYASFVFSEDIYKR